MTVADRKTELRRVAAARRAEIHAARGPAAADALAARFLSALGDDIAPGTIVSLFRPMRGEIDVGPLAAALADRGARTALPVMQGRDAPLVFRQWRAGQPLAVAAFGVEEPVDGPAVVPGIVVVPLLAFDAAGNRLGYGGGYYDRTLRHLRAEGRVLAVGVAYDEQEMPAVPAAAHDAPLDLIVTDRRTIEIASEAGPRGG